MSGPGSPEYKLARANEALQQYPITEITLKGGGMALTPAYRLLNRHERRRDAKVAAAVRRLGVHHELGFAELDPERRRKARNRRKSRARKHK